MLPNWFVGYRDDNTTMHRKINCVARHSLNTQRFFLFFQLWDHQVSRAIIFWPDTCEISREFAWSPLTLSFSTNSISRKTQEKEWRMIAIVPCRILRWQEKRPGSPLQQTLNNFNESPSQIVRSDFTTLIGIRIFAWLLVFPLRTLFYLFALLSSQYIPLHWDAKPRYNMKHLLILNYHQQKSERWNSFLLAIYLLFKNFYSF